MNSELIKTALEKSTQPVVAFSGGKDSTVVLDLVRSFDPSVPAIFCNTGVEYPETKRYCHSIDNLIELTPHGNFWELVKVHGWPTQKGKKGGGQGPTNVV